MASFSLELRVGAVEPVHVLARQEADLAVADRRHLPFGRGMIVSAGAPRPLCIERTVRIRSSSEVWVRPRTCVGSKALAVRRWQLGVGS